MARELARCISDFVGVEMVRWDKRGRVRAGNYNFFYRKRNENHQLGTGFFVHYRVVSAVKTIESVSDKMSYIVLRDRCYIIVLKVHAPSEERSDDSKDSCYEELEQVFNYFPKYYMKIPLRDFKPTIENESLHQDSNDNGATIVNFATPKNLAVKSTMSLHRNIHKYTCTSSDGKTHNQIDHILIDRRYSMHDFQRS